MAKLRLYVHVVELDEDGQPSGRSATFGPDDEVPDWAIANITNPDVWAVPPADAGEAEPKAAAKDGQFPAKPERSPRKPAAPRAGKAGESATTGAAVPTHPPHAD